MGSQIAKLWNALDKRVVFTLSLIAAIWIVFNILSGGYILRAENMANLFRQVTVVAVLACGMTLIIVSGHIDLSVGSALGMFGAVCAAMVTNLDIDPHFSVATVLLLGFAVGCVHGSLVHFFNIPAFVVTLGGLIAYRGVTQYVARQSIPIRVEWIKAIAQESVPHWFSIGLMVVVLAVLALSIVQTRKRHTRAQLEVNPVWIDVVKYLLTAGLIIAFIAVMLQGEGVPVQVVILLAVATIISLATRLTPFGHYVYAVGGNRQAAHYSGISIARNTIGIFGLMGFLSALAGIITVSELSSAAPDIGDLKELETIAACVIGGTSLMGGSGTIGMSVLGALIMASIKNGMSMMGIVAQMQKVILGSVLVIAVALDQWSRKARR
ncbi:MAG: sugar ABC transporter permease [Chitinivibrionales bacterium]|nr:sugar ABC transporter permease [Chitinivibrionales bacterium]MBD3396453.1 sugar ABC transporter permease [Chitinivibrionales bacterium]